MAIIMKPDIQDSQNRAYASAISVCPNSEKTHNTLQYLIVEPGIIREPNLRLANAPRFMVF